MNETMTTAIVVALVVWVGTTATLSVCEMSHPNGYKWHNLIFWPLFVLAWIPGALFGAVRDGFREGFGGE